MTSPLLNPGQLWLGVVRGSDEEAFQSLLSIMLKPGIDPKSFVHGAVTPDPSDPNKVTTPVSVSRAKADISLWPYTDSLAISYKRVKLSEVANYFGNTIRVDFPTTIKEMMAVYFSRLGLHDRSDQVIDGNVDDLGVYEVSAIPGMAFIEGSTSFIVKPFQRQLTEVLQTTTIDGFRVAADMQSVDDRVFLLDQLSAVNPDLRYPLEYENLSFDTPVNISGYARNNTSVVLTARGDGVHIGEIEIIYTRHDFAWSTGGNQHYVEGPSVPTTQYMIDKVTELTGFQIKITDVIVETYSAIQSGELETLTIFFNPESTRYAGELTIDYRAV